MVSKELRKISKQFSRRVVGVLYPRYHRSPITAQNSDYDRFPPAVNRWGTTHPVPNMTPPLLAKEEGSPT
jgi:hypothetical protein